ncbi:hypothetical protein [Vibrio phage vB_VpaS_CHI]|nr:hypothetical protein [Vibrio phage vB_VpaS_ALK]USL90076.1 hypothetical protein [Vibrio phage vB_VpaS_CHI]
MKRFNVWECKLVIPEDTELPNGADNPFRKAVLQVAKDLDLPVEGCLSGWGGSLTRSERDAMPSKFEGNVYIAGLGDESNG